MKTNLEGKNIDNTHPAELKRLEREEINSRIKSHKKRIEFSLVNSIFFLFASYVIINSQVINPYIFIFTLIAFVVSTIAFFIFREHLKTEKIGQRMLEMFYKHYDM